MTTQFDPRHTPKVIDLLLPEQVEYLGLATPVPVLDLPLADGRKWCQAALAWLEGTVPAGCPTGDLRVDGTCRRSPTHGACLLTLPGDHPDWTDACRYRYDPRRHVISPRPQPAPPPTRPPLVLEEMERCRQGGER